MSKKVIPIENFDGKEYIFFPACVYNGNRFASVVRNYPPTFTEGEAKVDMPVTITDVPRLNLDGTGIIEVTTGDVSVPCMGMYSAERGEGMLIFTIQEGCHGNLGLCYSNGVFTVANPENRKEIYRFPGMHKPPFKTMLPNPDFKIEDESSNDEIPCKVLKFECKGIEEFYDAFFKNRRIMGLDSSRPENISEHEQWEIQRKKMNSCNFDPLWGYNIDSSGKRNALGWCSGGMFGYSMMRLGDDEEWERGIRSLEYIYSSSAQTGLFSCNVLRDGTAYGDGHGLAGTQNYVMIRRLGDVLYFSIKNLELIRERGKEMPENAVQGVKKLADALVCIWKRYGQLGQIIDYTKGEIVVGGSTAGGIVPAGLALASRFFGEKKYLEVAELIAEHLYSRDARSGYTTGGPGEILQCPDSESCFGLLESLVVLYESTANDAWLRRAEYLTKLFSSWVMPYNFKFPEASECARLGIKTTGTVFANIQNKHSAPGICTYSGDAIYKLWRYTGNELYLELILDIKRAIPQFMSTEQRPIASYPISKGISDDTPRLVPGQICERVHTSDWDGDDWVGSIPNYSCWCEISNLLTLAELPEI